MALLQPTDLQTVLNIDLTTPNGEAAATALIDSAQANASSIVGYPLESGAQILYVEDGRNPIYLPTMAPVTAVIVSRYNLITNAYDAMDSGLIRWSSDGSVYTSDYFPCGFQAVKVDYTAGWTADNLPADLKQALIELVGIKLEAVNTGASTDAPGPIKRVTAGSYTEEYDTSGSTTAAIGHELPAGVLEVLARYRLPVVL